MRAAAKATGGSGDIKEERFRGADVIGQFNNPSNLKGNTIADVMGQTSLGETVAAAQKAADPNAPNTRKDQITEGSTATQYKEGPGGGGPIERTAEGSVKESGGPKEFNPEVGLFKYLSNKFGSGTKATPTGPGASSLSKVGGGLFGGDGKMTLGGFFQGLGQIGQNLGRFGGQLGQLGGAFGKSGWGQGISQFGSQFNQFAALLGGTSNQIFGLMNQTTSMFGNTLNAVNGNMAKNTLITASTISNGNSAIIQSQQAQIAELQKTNQLLQALLSKFQKNDVMNGAKKASKIS